MKQLKRGKKPQKEHQLIESISRLENNISHYNLDQIDRGKMRITEIESKQNGRGR